MKLKIWAELILLVVTPIIVGFHSGNSYGAPIARQNPLLKTIQVKFTGKGFFNAEIATPLAHLAFGYDDLVILKLEVTNTSPKAIAGIKGTAHFTNMFGDPVDDILIEVTNAILPGSTLQWQERIRFNPFDEQMINLKGANAKTLRFTFEPQMIVFKDGSQETAASPTIVAPQPNMPAATRSASPAPSGGPKQGEKLRAIFNLHNLGVQIEWFEQHYTGAPMKVDREPQSGVNDRLYQVAGCNVVAGVAPDNSVTALGLYLTKSCSFRINQMINYSKKDTAANKLTFGEFAANWGIKQSFTTDCLDSCGNAVSPYVYLTAQGSHADNFMTILLVGKVDKDEDIADADVNWEEAVSKEKSRDFVLDMDNINCSSARQRQGLSFFKDVKPTMIIIDDGVDTIEEANAESDTLKDCPQ